jgi:hypothetical protein
MVRESEIPFSVAVDFCRAQTMMATGDGGGASLLVVTP